MSLPTSSVAGKRQVRLRPWLEPGSDGFERFGLVLVALLVCGLTYAYATHMQRQIVFDEIGLHNPVYTFYKTGHMTYPMHGDEGYMVVHPPTHYAVVGLLMKAGLSLFTAAAVPVIVLTGTLALIVVFGPFSTSVGIALLLGYFVALTTWSEFYTLRPDLHVSAAWFTALVTLESARLRSWSSWRLFLGSVLAVWAATVHYWGITALLLPVCYLGLAVWQRGLRNAMRQVAAVTAGGCLVGVPFLVLFVVPLYEPITRMVAGVQGDGTPVDAFARHLQSYAALAQRLPGSYGVRLLSSTMASPALLLSIPAVFFAVPLLARVRELRVLAGVGAILPLFVLFLSQGKQVGYTGYLTPEFALLFVGLLATLLALIVRVRPERCSQALWTRLVTGLVTIAALIGVPTSMGQSWAWTPRLDSLDVLRGASQRLLGSDAAVAVTSAGVWYTAGGRYVWNAFGQIAAANRQGQDAMALLAPLDAVVLDTNWWNARPDLAPTGTWYAEGRLHLKGFVLPVTDFTRHMMQLFLSARQEAVRGVFVDQKGAREFAEDPSGPYLLDVFVCPTTPDLSSFAHADYRFAFAYDRQPAADSPSLLLLGMPVADADEGQRMAADGCVIRDSRRGTLTDLDLTTLRADVANEPPIEFFSLSQATLEAKNAPTLRLREQALARKVKQALAADALVGRIPIEVDASGITIRLRSEATNREERVRAVAVASAVDGVGHVEDWMK